MATKQNVKDKHVIEEAHHRNGQIGGKIEMSEDVVATIAGLACREISGIHSLGRSRLINLRGDTPSRGVAAEVGAKEAALDIEIIIDHGCDIRDVAQQLRDRVANEVEQMTGRKVVEVNLDVVGVHLPEMETAGDTAPQPRVQ